MLSEISKTTKKIKDFNHEKIGRKIHFISKKLPSTIILYGHQHQFKITDNLFYYKLNKNAQF